MTAFADWILALAAFWQDQLLGTFAAPGSTFSFGALVLTLLTACALIIRRRTVAFRTLLRALFPRRLWRSRSGRADMAWFAFSILGGGTLFAWTIVASTIIGTATATGLEHWFGMMPPAPLPQWIVMPLTTLILFVAYEFAYWLDHWAMHRFEPAWAFHQVHHSAESLSLLTIARVHPVETIGFHNVVAVVMGITTGALAFVFGAAASPATLFGSNILTLLGGILITHLQHSHLWVTFGPRWGRWLLGPAHHQIHHSVAFEHHDRNFGNCLSVFDRLFGTFTMPAPTRQPIRFGIDAKHFDAHSVHGMTVQPFIESARALSLIGRPCDEADYAGKGIAPRTGLLRRDQLGGLHARDHERGLALRPRIARFP